MSRRAFLKTLALAGAGVLAGGPGAWSRAFAQQTAPRSATQRPVRILMGGYSPSTTAFSVALKRIGDRVRENYRAAFTYDDALVTTIAKRCKEVETGARNIDHILTGTLLPEVSCELLTRMAQGQTVQGIHVGVDDSGKFVYQIK